jgi:deoxyribonuclease V
MEKEELIKKYNIDLESLEKEQIKLAKQLEIKDRIDFSLADKFGAFFTTFIGNKILSCIIICDKNYELVDRAYAFEKVMFPYLAGFRAYRELPAMMIAFNKLNEKPDVMLVPGYGISHPRLGLASHFSVLSGIPSIGISNTVVECGVDGKEIDGHYILKNGKKVGRVLQIKPGSRPMYVSPGNLIGVDTSYKICKQFINLPHKFPEPIHLAKKYGREVEKELKRENNVKLA